MPPLGRNILFPTSDLKIILEMEIVYSSETSETYVEKHLPENMVS
jgi:hypothetical protein